MGLDFSLMGKLPDPAGDMQRAIQFKIGLDQAKLKQRLGELEINKAQREVEAQDAFTRDMQAYLSNPTAEGYARIIGAHPEFQKQASEAWKALDGARQTSDFTAMGEIAVLMKSGNYDRAATRLEARIAADKAAGHVDPQDEYLLESLKSGNPARQKEALGLVTMAIGAADPEHAKSFLESMGLSREPHVREVDGILYDDNTGEAIAQSPYPNIIAGPDGSFYQNTPGRGAIPGVPVIGGGAAPTESAPATPSEGGDPASSSGVDAGSVWSRMVGPDGRGGIEAGTNPDGSFRTSPKGAIGPAQVMPGTAPEAARLAGLPWDENRYRSDAGYNLALGKAYFAKQLQDFGEPALAAAAYNAGPGRVRRAVIAGGRNWLQRLPKETQDYVRAAVGAGAQYAQARSKQEYDRLPSGTKYVAPDGSVRIKG